MATSLLATVGGTLLLHAWFSDAIPFHGRQDATYVNPILDGNYADPWMFQFNETWYLMPTMPDGGVSIFKSDHLDNFHGIASTKLWTQDHSNLWAPEMHFIDGNWYVYGALQDGDLDSDRRTHVLLGSDPNDPTAGLTDLGVITTPDTNYAIDSTILDYNDKKYFIWSGKESPETDTVQYLYIAEMANATHLLGERVMIHSPYWPDGSRKEWQWSPSNTAYGVNEGPEVLKNGDQTFVIYSACGSWDDCYSLGIIGLNSTNLDPLDPTSWWAKDDGPIFQGNNKTVGTGHASFTTDAANVPFIVYHGWDYGAPAGWGSREVRTQSFDWNPDGTPRFPEPAGRDEELPAAASYVH